MSKAPDAIQKLSNLQQDEILEDGADFGLTPTNMTRLKKIVQLCQRMDNEVDFRTVSGKTGKQVKDGAKSIYDALESLNRGSGDLPRGQRNLQEGMGKVFEASGIILATAGSDTAHQHIERIKKLESEAKNLLDSVSDTKKEVGEIEEKLKESAQAGAVNERAQYFSDEANKHWWYSVYALGVSITFAVLVVVYALFLIFGCTGISEASSTIQERPMWIVVRLAITRIAIFSLLFFGLVTSARTYRSERHNYVVNRHRYNALMTFEVFTKTTDEPAVKNAVLLRTTESIFSPQQTGFKLDNSGQQSSFSTNVADIIKNVSKRTP